MNTTNLIIKRMVPEGTIFEALNYSGPIPRKGDYIRTHQGSQEFKVIAVTYIFDVRPNQLAFVIVEV